MKKRYLRPVIQNTLTIITMVLFILIMSLDDFTFDGIPMIIAIIGCISLNIYLLTKYGKWKEGE